MDRAGLVRLAALIIVAGVIVMAASRGNHNDSPVYRGRHLLFWLQEAASSQGARHAESVKAIRSIGTNAIPELLTMLNAKDSRAVALVRRWRCQSIIRLRTANDCRFLAHTGFLVLGHTASSAEPALIDLAQSKDPEIRRVAQDCLFDVRGGMDIPGAAPAF